MTQLQQHQNNLARLNYYYLKKINNNNNNNYNNNNINNKSANCSSTDSSSSTNNFSGFSLNESIFLNSGRSSCVSNSHTATHTHSSPSSSSSLEIKQQNFKLITSDTFEFNDMEDLINILNDSLNQWDHSYNLFVKLKSNQTETTNMYQVQNLADGSIESLEFYSMKSTIDLARYVSSIIII